MTKSNNFAPYGFCVKKISIALYCIILIESSIIFGQSNTIYFNSEYRGISIGTINQPFNIWEKLEWKDGYTYLFKRGTTLRTDSKLRPQANNITIGAYGEGRRPMFISSVQNNEKVFDLGSLKNITISDIEVKSINNAQSCFHFMNSDDGALINCKMQGSEYGVRNVQSTGYFRIINCEIFMTSDDGSYNQDLDSIEVYGTHIHHVNQKWFINPSETYSGGDALQLHNVKYFKVYNNWLDHSGSGNKFCFISENGNKGLITTGEIFNNTFIRSDEGNCIYLYYDQKNVVIRGNKFINAGIAIYNHSVNLSIYNNEFVNITKILFEVLNTKESNTKVFNNTVYNKKDLSLSVYDSIIIYRKYIDE